MEAARAGGDPDRAFLFTMNPLEGVSIIINFYFVNLYRLVNDNASNIIFL